MKKINVKNLILSLFLAASSLILLFIMFMPIFAGNFIQSPAVFEIMAKPNYWVDLEQYLIGIGSMIGTILLPILFLGSVGSILCSLNVIKNKKVAKALYIINIVIAFLVFATLVNYLLGLGRSLTHGRKFFVGITYFDFATPFFYVYSVFATLALIAACFNCPKAKKTKKRK